MKNIIKFIPLLSLLFLLNGCLIPFSSAKIVPQGVTELGTGTAGGKEEGKCGYDCYALLEQSAIIIRRGIGHNMDCGIEIGLIALSLEIRKQIVSETPFHPSIVLSGSIFGGFPAIVAEIGGSISLQLHYKIFSFTSGYSHMYVSPLLVGFCEESCTEKVRMLANTFLVEIPGTEDCSVYFLIGHLSYFRDGAKGEIPYAGASLVYKFP